MEESVAHNVSDIYIGIPTEVPVYDENSGNVSLTPENIETYFDVSFEGDNNTFQWINDALVSDFENPVEPSAYSDVSTFMVIPRSILSLVAKSQVQLSFDIDFNNELSTLIAVDELTITLNDMETVSIDSNQSLSYTLNEGDNIVVRHSYANGVSYVSLSNLNILRDKEIIGTYTESYARKIIKAYVGDENGKARLWWEKLNVINYSITTVSNSTNSFTCEPDTTWENLIGTRVGVHPGTLAEDEYGNL
jgi:hypothetical protein